MSWGAFSPLYAGRGRGLLERSAQGPRQVQALGRGQEAPDRKTAPVRAQGEGAVVAGRVVDQDLEPVGLEAPDISLAPVVDALDHEVAAAQAQGLVHPAVPVVYPEREIDESRDRDGVGAVRARAETCYAVGELKIGRSWVKTGSRSVELETLPHSDRGHGDQKVCRNALHHEC